MSLGDHLRYVRATKGGARPSEFYEGLPSESVRRIAEAELRYGDHTNDELVEELAKHLKLSAEELNKHRSRSRKALSLYLTEAQNTTSPVTLKLRGGETLSGHLVWWDLGAIGVERSSGNVTVVQRHAVTDWEGASEAE